MTWREGFLDLVYPPRCLLCEGWEEPILCTACLGLFNAVPEPCCVVCGHTTPPGVICRLCEAAADQWGGWAFATARAAGRHDGALRAALHLLKYRQKDMLAEPLGQWLATRCVVDGLLPSLSYDILVPLPLSARKRRSRGYNQTELLARPLAEQLGLTLLPEPAFIRTRAEQAQMTLGSGQRRGNLSADDFQVVEPERIAGKRLLLLDDVMTTGTTLHFAAAALRKAGALEVDAVTLSQAL